MSSNSLLNNLIQDERRNLYQNNNTNNNQNNYTLSNHIINDEELIKKYNQEQQNRNYNVFNNTNNSNNADTYQPMMQLQRPVETRLNNNDKIINNNGEMITSLPQTSTKVQRKIPDTITENLGIIYNNDSKAQLSLTNPQSKDEQNKYGLEVEKKHIIINSGDRDWTNTSNDDTIFNFTVSFDGGSYRTVNNINYKNNINIDTIFENVISISCTNLILPNRADINNIKPSSFPYINLSIDNINNVSQGSNKNLNKCIAHMSSLTPIISVTNYKFIDLRNINLQKKEYKTPQTKLKNLEIQISRPDGNKVQSRTDVLSIKKIYYVGNTLSTNTNLYIATNDYFTNIEYEVGDIIKIKNYTFRETGTGSLEFNTFINREEGHIITDIDRTPPEISKDLYNLISIKIPGIYSSGNFIKETYFTSLISGTTIEVPSNDISGFDSVTDDNSTTGMIINTNLQSQLFIELEILKKNPNHLIKGIY
tara:strand:+ start:52 stop:1488 length:1437 start_codon:yes stop_codon:yes gene_type:complete